ncbi:MAG: 4Fe-4S dicluster domain-containing protein [Desulfobacteraceae bacterium]|nr:4Fe-4S dicluster domain-containing protein [Desulfobacteraceae bacterium]
MQDEFERALSDAAARFCVECGKCTAACPMAEMYSDFSWDLSPRGIVQQALRGRDILTGKAVWCCTQCEACTRTCPAGVDCCGLVAGLRPLARTAQGAEAPVSGACADCGAPLPPKPVLDYLRSALHGAELRYLSLCPACRRQAYIRNNS